MSDTPSIPLADPASLLGQLQRGSGAGFLRALAQHPADLQPLLRHCLTHDPRCCRLVERRAEYYAELIILAEVDLAPLADDIRRQNELDPDDSAAWLLLETFGELAKRGSGPALAMLRDYVTWGQHWDGVLGDLADLQSLSAVDGLDEVLCRRFPSDEELREGLWSAEPEQEPWTSWMAANPRFDRLIRQNEAERAARPDSRQIRPEWRDLTLPELFERVTRRNRYAIGRAVKERTQPADLPYLLSLLDPETPERAYLALWALQHVPDEQAAEPLRRFVEAGGYPGWVNRAVFKALEALPGECTLPFVRRWFRSVDPRLRHAGGILLSESAEQEDLDLLRGHIPGAMADDDMYRVCNLLEGLLRLELPSELPEVEEAYRGATYAWARIRAVRVLCKADPERFAREQAPECLWDCEPDVRELGCGAADLTLPGVSERIHELAEAPWEDKDVRDAAQERLRDGDALPASPTPKL